MISGSQSAGGGGKTAGGEKSLAQKLRLPIRGRALILNPPPGYIDSLGEQDESLGFENRQLESAANVNEGTGSNEASYDFVQLFIKNRQELDQFGPFAWSAVKYDGLLWVCYPKQSAKVPTDINRDSLWELMMPTGLRPVMQISIDPVWSALRFRPAEAVGK